MKNPIRTARLTFFAVGIVFVQALSGCAEKPPDVADIKGTNAPKVDPHYARAKMAEAMGKMAAAGGIKKIDPNH